MFGKIDRVVFGNKLGVVYNWREKAFAYIGAILVIVGIVRMSLVFFGFFDDLGFELLICLAGIAFISLAMIKAMERKLKERS